MAYNEKQVSAKELRNILYVTHKPFGDKVHPSNSKLFPNIPYRFDALQGSGYDKVVLFVLNATTKKWEVWAQFPNNYTAAEAWKLRSEEGDAVAVGEGLGLSPIPLAHPQTMERIYTEFLARLKSLCEMAEGIGSDVKAPVHVRLLQTFAICLKDDK